MHLIEKCENGDRFAAFRMSRIACSMKTLFDFFFGMRRERSSGWYHSWVVRYFNSKRKAYGTDSDSSLCMGLNPGWGCKTKPRQLWLARNLLVDLKWVLKGYFWGALSSSLALPLPQLRGGVARVVCRGTACAITGSVVYCSRVAVGDRWRIGRALSWGGQIIVNIWASWSVARHRGLAELALSNWVF